jgi:hypothetical protein
MDWHLMKRREISRGVFHAAGVLDDRLFVNQTTAALRYVFAPKAVPSRMIDRLSVSVEWTNNLYASSIAASIGTMGQANYAAANAYMNSLAAKRAGYCLKCVALMWDAVAEVGMASRVDAETSCADQFQFLSIREVQRVFRRCVSSPMPPSHLGVTHLVFMPTEEHTLSRICSNVEVMFAC